MPNKRGKHFCAEPPAEAPIEPPACCPLPLNLPEGLEFGLHGLQTRDDQNSPTVPLQEAGA